MPETKNLLIIINKAYNQYAAYVVAFMAKQITKIDAVTLVSLSSSHCPQSQIFLHKLLDKMLGDE